MHHLVRRRWKVGIAGTWIVIATLCAASFTRAATPYEAQLSGRVQTVVFVVVVPGKTTSQNSDAASNNLDRDRSRHNSVRAQSSMRTCVYSSPRLIGDSVIFGSNGGVVRGIDPTSLEVIGRVAAPDALTNAIAFAADGKRVFVSTHE